MGNAPSNPARSRSGEHAAIELNSLKPCMPTRDHKKVRAYKKEEYCDKNAFQKQSNATIKGLRCEQLDPASDCKSYIGTYTQGDTTYLKPCEKHVFLCTKGASTSSQRRELVNSCKTVCTNADDSRLCCEKFTERDGACVVTDKGWMSHELVNLMADNYRRQKKVGDDYCM